MSALESKWQYVDLPEWRSRSRWIVGELPSGKHWSKRWFSDWGRWFGIRIAACAIAIEVFGRYSSATSWWGVLTCGLLHGTRWIDCTSPRSEWVQWNQPPALRMANCCWREPGYWSRLKVSFSQEGMRHSAHYHYVVPETSLSLWIAQWYLDWDWYLPHQLLIPPC